MSNFDGRSNSNSSAFDCLKCPIGGFCPGGDSPPLATAGYIVTPDIKTFAQCIPPTSCVWDASHPRTYKDAPVHPYSNSLCSVGYKGLTCGSCVTGFHRFEGACVACPDTDTPLLGVGIASFFVLLLVSAAWYFSSRVKIAMKARESLKSGLPLDWGLIGMAIVLIQTVASYKDINLKWSPPIQKALNIASTMNFNLDLASPECAIPLTIPEKWWMTQIAPFAIILFVLLGSVAHAAHRGDTRNPWPRRISYCLQVLNFFYFAIARNTLRVFDCQDNGRYLALSSEPSVECDFTSPEYLQLFIPAVVFVVIYLIGMPVTFFYLLYSNRGDIIKYQTFQKSLSERDLFTTPPRHQVVEVEETDVLIKYGFLYDHYTPQVYTSHASRDSSFVYVF
jgi:hypothetical protein